MLPQKHGSHRVLEVWKIPLILFRVFKAWKSPWISELGLEKLKNHQMRSWNLSTFQNIIVIAFVIWTSPMKTKLTHRFLHNVWYKHFAAKWQLGSWKVLEFFCFALKCGDHSQATFRIVGAILLLWTFGIYATFKLYRTLIKVELPWLPTQIKVCFVGFSAIIYDCLREQPFDI